MVSKALVSAAYHKKIEEMAALVADIWLVVPERWGKLELEVKDAKSYRICKRPIWFNGRNHLHLYRGLREVMESIKPDVVHVDEEYYSLVTWQVVREAIRVQAKPLFFTWQNIYKKYPLPFRRIEVYNFRHCPMAIAGSEEAMHVLRKKSYDKPIAVIPQFGVDPDMFHPKDSSAFKEELEFDKVFVVGFMGRFVEEKGLTLLVEAFQKLAKQGHNLGLLFVGDGPMMRRLKHYAHSIPRGQGRMVIINHVSSCEVPRYLNAMDCLVLPSLTKPNWKEQFGRVLIEAMSCCVPVIGSDSGEIPNVIGDSGLIFREGNCVELADRIAFLENNVDARCTLASRGRQRILTNYTQKMIAAETIKAYEQISNV